MRRPITGLIVALALFVPGGPVQTAAFAQEPSPTPSESPSPEATASPSSGGATGTETIGGSGDNVAVAINTKDGTSRFTISFRIVRTSSDVVDQTNIAFAFASCEGCETVAIAMQAVLVSGSPSTVIPENYAIALNFECTSCDTLASAYQFVLGVDGNPHFTPEGNTALAEIRRALRALTRSDLSIEEIQAELDVLAEDLRTVLAEEIVTAGPPDAAVEVPEDGATPTPSPTGTPSPTPTTSPTSDSVDGVSPTPEPSATVSSSPEPSVSPSASPSESPSPSPAASASP